MQSEPLEKPFFFSLFSGVFIVFEHRKATSSSLGSRRNSGRGLLAGSVVVTQNKVLAEKFQISLFNMKTFLRLATETETASLEQGLGVVRTKMRKNSQKVLQKFL